MQSRMSPVSLALKASYKEHACIIHTGILGHDGETRRDLFRTGPCEQRLCLLGDTVAESILVSLVCWIDMRFEQRGYLAPQTVSDRLIDNANLFTRINKNTYLRSLLWNELNTMVQWPFFIYRICWYIFLNSVSSIKWNYLVANNLRAQTIWMSKGRCS